MKVISEQVVGARTIAGRRILVQRITWSDTSGLSFDVLDACTGACLTEYSFDTPPTDVQIQDVLECLEVSDLTASTDPEPQPLLSEEPAPSPAIGHSQ